MRREKTSVSREDYLKAIWEMVQEDHDPIMKASVWPKNLVSRHRP